MGQLKKTLDDNDEKDFAPNDNFLCSQHIDDYAIKAEILKWAELGTCSYCNMRRKVVLYKDILPFIETGVSRMYSKLEEEALFYDNEEQEYWGVSPLDTPEMLYEVGLEVNDNRLLEDIIQSFGDDSWCNKDPYADNEQVELNYNWKEFKKVVKHKARYVFLGSKQFQTGLNKTSIDEILHEVGRRVEALDLFLFLKPGSTLYRCRQHTVIEKIDKAKDFSAPPENLCFYPNRMSPAGIPMFYCAFDKKTAIQETFDPNGHAKTIMSTGVFASRDSLYLLNLSKLPKVPSIFDEKHAKHYYSILFLREFVKDLSGPISRNGKEHIDYVPTQIVTEYFRYTFEELTNISIDGIIYPSSKNIGHDACVLFYNQKETLTNLEFYPKKITIRVLKFAS